MSDIEDTYEEEFDDDDDDDDENEENENEDNSDSDLEDEDDNNISIIGEIESNIESKRNMLEKEKITRPVLTRFEHTRLIGERTAQLQRGAQPMIDVRNLRISDCRTIAELELKEKRIPLIIRRYLPDGNYEDWRLSELINPHLL